MLIITAVFVALTGGALGSFIGVVSSRGLRASLGGRSHCDSCLRILNSYELVPLISYVALRGRCRTCRATVGWKVFAWELGGGLIALAVSVPLLIVNHV
jgi:leader peptidase (prepilin peptidase)/N-methyltransferase